MSSAENLRLTEAELDLIDEAFDFASGPIPMNIVGPLRRRVWRIVADRVRAAEARAEKAEAKVARVEALLDCDVARILGPDVIFTITSDDLRAALADPDPTFDAREIAYKTAQDNAEPIGGE